MKTIMKIALAISALAVASTPAAATPFGCSSEVQKFGMGSDGTVQITTSFGFPSICNVVTALGGVSTDACKTWLAKLLTARGMNKVVTFYFNTDHPTNSALTTPYCTSTNFNGSVRIPYHIEF